MRPSLELGGLTVGSYHWTRRETTRETYEALLDFLSKGRSKTERTYPYGRRSTVVRKNGEKIEIQLYNTIIMTFWPDRFSLNSGGYRTVTTKARINEFLPQKIYLSQDKSVWYLNGIPFFDGIIIRNDKINTRTTTKTKQELVRIGRIKKQVKAYLEKLGKMIDKRKLPDPGPGDCWLCMMRDVKTGKLDPGGQDHFLSHLREKYVHGTLVWNALEDKGMNVEFLWQAYYRSGGDSFLQSFKEFVLPAVRRWFYKNLGIAR